MRKKPRVALGVTGSIAAFKAVDLVRLMRKEGWEVRCVLTPNARHFVTPLTLQTLSGKTVLCDLFDPMPWDVAHLGVADQTDVVLIAPATADVIARLAQGRANDLLTTLVLSVKCPVVIAPAMHEFMWTHAATRANVETLKSYGYRFIGPVRGKLSRGDEGEGRMSEPDQIIQELSRLLDQKGKGKKEKGKSEEA